MLTHAEQVRLALKTDFSIDAIMGNPSKTERPQPAGAARGPPSEAERPPTADPKSSAGAVAKRPRPKKYQCPYCWVALSNTGQFRGHIRIHTGERPFKCDQPYCQKTFTRNEELTRHRRIHTGQRPYACKQCNKCFGRKDHLKKHMRTHERANSAQTSVGSAAPAAPPSNQSVAIQEDQQSVGQQPAASPSGAAYAWPPPPQIQTMAPSLDFGLANGEPSPELANLSLAKQFQAPQFAHNPAYLTPDQLSLIYRLSGLMKMF